MNNQHMPYYRRYIGIYKMAGNVPEPMKDRRVGVIVVNLYAPDALDWDVMKRLGYYAVTEGGVR